MDGNANGPRGSKCSRNTRDTTLKQTCVLLQTSASIGYILRSWIPLGKINFISWAKGADFGSALDKTFSRKKVSDTYFEGVSFTLSCGQRDGYLSKRSQSNPMAEAYSDAYSPIDAQIRLSREKHL